MSESLEKIIRSVSELKKLAELEELASNVVNAAEDIESYVYRRYPHFAIRFNNFIGEKEMSVTIMGERVSISMIVPRESRLVDILDRFFEKREFIDNALVELADNVEKLADKIIGLVWEVTRKDC
jgi:hypothetical protein